MAETAPDSRPPLPYTCDTLQALGEKIGDVAPLMISFGELQEELVHWEIVVNAMRAVRAYGEGREERVSPRQEYEEPPFEHQTLKDTRTTGTFIAEIVTRDQVPEGDIPGGKFLLLHRRIDGVLMQTAQLPVDWETDDLLIGGKHDKSLTVMQTCATDQLRDLRIVSDPADAAAIIGGLVSLLASSVEARTQK